MHDGQRTGRLHCRIIGMFIVPASLAILFFTVPAHSQQYRYTVNSGIVQKYGFVNIEGKLKIPMQYAHAQSFSENVALVSDSKGSNDDSKAPGMKRYGFIDKNNKIVVPFALHESISSFKEGIARVRDIKKGKYIQYCIDMTGKTVFNYEAYDLGISSYSEGLAVFPKTYDGHGYMDKTGKTVIPPIYSGARDFTKEGLAPVEINMQWGFIDKSGKLVINAEYSDVTGFSDGLCGVIKYSMQGGGRQIGYINAKGEIVVPFDKYIAPNTNEKLKGFSEGMVAVKMRGADGYNYYGFADKTGKLVIPCGYYAVGDFHDGLAAVMVKNGNWGYIDSKGNMVVPPVYDKADDFSEALAPVAKAVGNYESGTVYKWGYVNKNGTMVVPLEYGAALPFTQGMGLVHNFIFKKVR